MNSPPQSPQSPKSPKLYADFTNAPIYIFEGHGADMCDKNGQLIESIVPPNVMYITMQQCGLSTVVSNSRSESYWQKLEEFKSPFLFTPNSLTSFLNAAKAEGFAHVKTPGMTYVVGSFMPIAWWANNDIYRLSISGLCLKSKMEALRHPPESRIQHMKEQHVLSETDYVTLDDILTSIRYSDKEKEKFILDFLNMYQKQENNKTFLKKEVNININRALFLYKLSVEEVAKYFIASVYPTIEDVKNILYKKVKNPNQLTIQEFLSLPQYIFEIFGLKQSNEFRFTNEASPLSTKTIMEKFPGIHYSDICRAPGPTCKKEKLLLRRQVSLKEQNKLKEQRISSIKSFLEQDTLDKSDIDYIKKYLESNINYIKGFTLSEEEKEIILDIFSKFPSLYTMLDEIRYFTNKLRDLKYDNQKGTYSDNDLAQLLFYQMLFPEYNKYNFFKLKEGFDILLKQYEKDIEYTEQNKISEKVLQDRTLQILNITRDLIYSLLNYTSSETIEKRKKLENLFDRAKHLLKNTSIFDNINKWTQKSTKEMFNEEINKIQTNKQKNNVAIESIKTILKKENIGKNLTENERSSLQSLTEEKPAESFIQRDKQYIWRTMTKLNTEDKIKLMQILQKEKIIHPFIVEGKYLRVLFPEAEVLYRKRSKNFDDIITELEFYKNIMEKGFYFSDFFYHFYNVISYGFDKEKFAKLSLEEMDEKIQKYNSLINEIAILQKQTQKVYELSDEDKNSIERLSKFTDENKSYFEKIIQTIREMKAKNEHASKGGKRRRTRRLSSKKQKKTRKQKY